MSMILKGVVIRFVHYVQLNVCSTILTTGLFERTPQYVIISLIVLLYILVIGILVLFFYYIYKKFKSIDNHTDKKYHSKNDCLDTYRRDKKGYDKDIIELNAKILPEKNFLISLLGKLVDCFRKTK